MVLLIYKFIFGFVHLPECLVFKGFTWLSVNCFIFLLVELFSFAFHNKDQLVFVQIVN